MSTLDKDLEIIALRSQLALFYNEVESGKRPKPKAALAFRQLWILLSKHYSAWESILVFFKPATVIRWHKTAFKLFWMFKSRKKGRPSISPQTIALIRRIHKENPLLSPEKIHEKLALLGLSNPPVPNTIAKYLPFTKKPPSEKQIQSWKTFLKNQHLHHLLHEYVRNYYNPHRTDQGIDGRTPIPSPEY